MVGHRIQGGRHIARLGVGRGVAQRSDVIFAGVFLLVLAGKVQSINAIAAVMSSFVPD